MHREGYRGRRYLRYVELHALGVASARASLRDWIEKGAFPAPIRIASKYGTTLVWSAVEVAQHLAECFAERDAQPPPDEGAHQRDAPSLVIPSAKTVSRRVHTAPDAKQAVEVTARAQTDIALSNSLADLAARIRQEHEAAESDLTSGLRHAIACGAMLIEAKAKIGRGLWLGWLAEHCPRISERTAQAYMRVARAFGNLDDIKAKRVADLSYRDALRSLAATASVLKDLPPSSYDRALARVENHDHVETFRQAVARVRFEDKQNELTLESHAMLPPLNGRRIRVARNATERKWMLAIGPDVTLTALQERIRLAREDERVRSLRDEHADLIKRAADLEAAAKALRGDANSVGKEIDDQIKEIVGPAKPFTETYDFQCDDETVDAELAALSHKDLRDRLLTARGAAQGPIREIYRGYWGDMNFMSFQSPEPGPPRKWSCIGSPEWLDDLFPGWNADTSNEGGRP
jgi:hypothetical protein